MRACLLGKDNFIVVGEKSRGRLQGLRGLTWMEIGGIDHFLCSRKYPLSVHGGTTL